VEEVSDAVHARELVVLGCASQVPTRHRNHNGYALRFDDQLVLFDPGEGFQRQCTIAGLSIARATGLCLTHFHGDHCLGLPGVLQRRSLDAAPRALPVWFPADGTEYFERLRTSTIWYDQAGVVPMPVDPAGGGEVGWLGGLRVVARTLEHRVTAIGYRLEEPEGVRLDGAALAAAGIRGADVGRLLEAGTFDTGRRVHHVGEFARPRPGQSMAFIMDTRLCDAALELAAGVDLLVCESTYVDDEADLARDHYHLTARQAGWLAREAGARRLVLTHFSQRHPDARVFAEEARQLHDDVVAAEDFLRVPMPPRREA
jgi:ribonuclease Z